jgi:hypothetical protein
MVMAMNCIPCMIGVLTSKWKVMPLPRAYSRKRELNIITVTSKLN